MKINEYFDKVYYINLDKRPDRRAEMESELFKHGIVAERFAAIQGNGTLLDNERACRESHMAIICEVLYKNLKNVLILEDDCQFVDNFNDIFKYTELPEWDMLYFMGSHLEKPIPINDKIARITSSYSTGAYAVSSYMAHLIYTKRLDKYPIDVIYQQLQKTYKCYTFFPTVAIQKPGYSDVAGEFRNNIKDLKRFEKNENKLNNS